MLRPACAYAQSDQSICRSFEYSTTVKLLTEHHLEFLSLKGDCIGLSVSILVKMPHCWKSHVTAQMVVAVCLGLCVRQLVMVVEYVILLKSISVA